MEAATRVRQFWTNNDIEFVLYGKNVSPSCYALQVLSVVQFSKMHELLSETGKLMFIMFTENKNNNHVIHHI